MTGRKNRGDPFQPHVSKKKRKGRSIVPRQRVASCGPRLTIDDGTKIKIQIIGQIPVAIALASICLET
jgi:hypothetical protein